MKILVLSDNHYRNIDFNLNEYDYIIHLGDRGIFDAKGVIYVKGNCDYDGEKLIITNINNKKVLITHGDLYNVKETLIRLTFLAREKNVDYVFFGHTHIPLFFEYEKIKFINPGAYIDGRYVVINEEEIIFYKENFIEKKIKNEW